MVRITHTFSRTLLALTAHFLMLFLLLVPSAFGYAAMPTAQQSTEMARLRATGIQDDRSQISVLLKNLSAPPHRSYVKTCLHALAQLGATEALPAINRLCLNTADRDNQAYAQVARARLLAEDGSHSIGDTKAQAFAKISRFYQELGLTPADLNAALQHNPALSYQPQPLEVYAMREIADMVYQGSSQGRYADYTALPGVALVQFRLDIPAVLKMRLAAVPPEQRLDTIIQELAAKKILGDEEDYEIQLAVDGGLTASYAAAAKLQEMQTHKADYPSNGFVALLSVLHGVGDKEQAPLVAQLMDTYNVALFYPDIKNGSPRQIVAGY